MDATLKASIEQRARHVLQKELAEHGERYEAQVVYLEANLEEAFKRLKAVKDKRWESYDLHERFTRDEKGVVNGFV